MTNPQPPQGEQVTEALAKRLMAWGCGDYAPTVSEHMKDCRDAAKELRRLSTAARQPEAPQVKLAGQLGDVVFMLEELSRYFGNMGGEDHEKWERTSETLEFGAKRVAEARSVIARQPDEKGGAEAPPSSETAGQPQQAPQDAVEGSDHSARQDDVQPQDAVERVARENDEWTPSNCWCTGRCKEPPYLCPAITPPPQFEAALAAMRVKDD